MGAGNSSTKVLSSAAELNRLNTAAPGIVSASKAVIYGTSGEINTSKLQLNGSDVTASASEINILDGVTVDHTKINMLSGVSSSIQDQLEMPRLTPVLFNQVTRLFHLLQALPL